MVRGCFRVLGAEYGFTNLIRRIRVSFLQTQFRSKTANTTQLFSLFNIATTKLATTHSAGVFCVCLFPPSLVPLQDPVAFLVRSLLVIRLTNTCVFELRFLPCFPPSFSPPGVVVAYIIQPVCGLNCICLSVLGVLVPFEPG